MTKRDAQAKEYAAEQWRYIRIYGPAGDKLRLAEKEREAIEWCVELLDDLDSSPRADALRGLLERLG